MLAASNVLLKMIHCDNMQIWNTDFGEYNARYHKVSASYIVSIHGGQGYGMQRKHRKAEFCGHKGR